MCKYAKFSAKFEYTRAKGVYNTGGYNACTHTRARFTGQKIGDEGCKEVAKALMNNATITSVYLGGVYCNECPRFSMVSSDSNK